MATTTFPPNWFEVLSLIESTLSQAIRVAQTRESALPDAGAAACPVLPDLLPKHFEGLDARVRYVENPLQELDKALQGDEAHVRTQLTQFANLRERLTTWVEENQPALM